MSKDCYICGFGKGICQRCQTYYVIPVPDAPSPADALGGIDLNDLREEIPYVSDAPIRDLREGYDVRQESKRIQEVTKLGFTVVRSTPTTVLLDLDDVDAIQRYEEMREMFESKVTVKLREWWVSKGRVGKHVVIYTQNPLPVRTRIAFQALLGSDPKRELLNVYKLEKFGVAEPSLLFMPPGAFINVER